MNAFKSSSETNHCAQACIPALFLPTLSRRLGARQGQHQLSDQVLSAGEEATQKGSAVCVVNA